MIVDSCKCYKCQHYKQNDYTKFACTKYEEIPDEYIDGLKECNKYKEEAK